MRTLLLLVALCSCKTNRLVTDYVEITLESGKRDTITNTYWNKFYMDDYKMEWLLKKNGIQPKEVKDVRLVKSTVQKFSNRDL